MNETRDRLLTRYLLGDLPEEDADRLGPQLLEDSELFETAEALEGELVDAYVRAELDPGDRELFERHLLSERVAHRVADARALSRIAPTGEIAATAPRAERPVVVAAEPRLSWWERLFPAPARLAWAATLVTAVAAGLFAVQNFELQEELAELDRRAATEPSDEAALRGAPAIDDTSLDALERDLQAQEQANRELAEQLADTRQLLAEATDLAPDGERTRGPRGRGAGSDDGGRRDATNVVTRYLGQANRSAGENRLEPLALSPDDRFVRLQLQLDHRLGSDLIAQISREGTRVYEGRDLTVERPGSPRAIAILELPRGVFLPGTHEIRIVSADGGEERFYELEVTGTV